MAYIKQTWDDSTWAKGQKNFQNQLNYMEEGIKEASEGGSSSYTAGEGIEIADKVISVKAEVREGATKGNTAVQPEAINDMATKTWVGGNYYNTTVVDQKIADIKTTRFEVVDELPVTGETNVIYLKPNSAQTPENIYDEFIWVVKEEGQPGAYELIGTTQIELNSKVDKPNEPVAGQGVNVPYFFNITYNPNGAAVTDYTVDLLNKSKSFGAFTLNVDAAVADSDVPGKAGLMTSLDAKTLREAIPASIASLQDSKLNNPKVPAEAGGELNIPYFFELKYNADNVEVKDHTIDLLDNTKDERIFGLTINAASSDSAGLMKASDKTKLDGIDMSSKQDKLTAGNGITINNNVISATGGSEPSAYIKSATIVDNSLKLTDKNDADIVYSPESYMPFPAEFLTTDTITYKFAESVLNYEGFKAGKAWYGELKCTDMPTGLGNVECTVKALTDSIATIELSSSNRYPYKWEYNTASHNIDGHDAWKYVLTLQEPYSPKSAGSYDTYLDVTAMKDVQIAGKTVTYPEMQMKLKKSLTAGDGIIIDDNRRICATTSGIDVIANPSVSIADNTLSSIQIGSNKYYLPVDGASVDEFNTLTLYDGLGRNIVSCTVNTIIDSTIIHTAVGPDETEAMKSGVTGTGWINVSSAAARVPEAPDANGKYHLVCSVQDGNKQYSWELV